MSRYPVMWLSNAINANMIYWGKSLMWATLTTLSMGGWGARVKFWKEILNRVVTFFMYITFYTDVLYFSGSQDARLFLWRFDARKSDQNYSKGWSCQIVNFFFSSTPPTTVLYGRFLRSFEVKSSCQRSHSPEYGIFKLYIFIEYQDNMWV